MTQGSGSCEACAPRLAQHLLTVAGAAQVRPFLLAGGLLFPVSPDFSGTVGLRSLSEQGRQTATVQAIGNDRGATIFSMLEELDLLATRVRELAQTVQALRSDNQQLRVQLASAVGEIDSMRGRVDEAARRLDLLIERLPSAAAPGVPWNT